MRRHLVLDLQWNQWCLLMFKKRSYTKELLDEENILTVDLHQNLKELDIINRRLGGHAVSLKGIAKSIQRVGSPARIMDIGCGGGDALKAIAKWANEQSFTVTLTGVDLKSDCIDFARNHCKAYPGIRFVCDDFRTIFKQGHEINIVHAALFFHHFTEEEIIEFIKLCHKYKTIVVINDLERNPVAYYSIKWLTAVFSRSHLVKNDAPLSVRRGFKRREWEIILQRCGISNYEIKNCWAFRHLVMIYPDEK